MTITELALKTVVQFGQNPKSGVECPNEVMRDLAVRLIYMAGHSLEIKRYWTVLSFNKGEKLFIKLDADNPFNACDMIGSIYSVAKVLLNWKTEETKDLVDISEINEILSQISNKDITIVSIESNKARGILDFDFFESILKQRRYLSVFDICHLQGVQNKIYLIGRKNVIDDVLGKFRELILTRARY